MTSPNFKRYVYQISRLQKMCVPNIQTSGVSVAEVQTVRDMCIKNPNLTDSKLAGTSVRTT